MSNNRQFPPGWDERRVQTVLSHYESQTEDQAVAEDEAAFHLFPSSSLGTWSRKLQLPTE
uniref:Uncharacterized protein n=1 Tax=Candidatus Kentrum sp. MB TaxID=2138164 RepID=A0A451B9J4_9GAMM|nr:MAG: hypothetical protein BECKMB1821G_GA0114241_101128 [Candidatus Kentron sp. MB]VFK29830.1 MAG: hypothetical protein BECKMB1821I_GA0114274_101218 [Candidatus Kentron sp. MB]VFK74960.1 MAG: hypothetical protein BECKMB1821H_GA0114242_101318 [Candidatus Kentron sp. MB]